MIPDTCEQTQNPAVNELLTAVFHGTKSYDAGTVTCTTIDVSTSAALWMCLHHVSSVVRSQLAAPQTDEIPAENAAKTRNHIQSKPGTLVQPSACTCLSPSSISASVSLVIAGKSRKTVAREILTLDLGSETLGLGGSLGGSGGLESHLLENASNSASEHCV